MNQPTNRGAASLEAQAVARISRLFGELKNAGLTMPFCDDLVAILETLRGAVGADRAACWVAEFNRAMTLVDDVSDDSNKKIATA